MRVSRRNRSRAAQRGWLTRKRNERRLSSEESKRTKLGSRSQAEIKTKAGERAAALSRHRRTKAKAGMAASAAFKQRVPNLRPRR